MSDLMLAFMFLTMVVSPCVVARLICNAQDNTPLLLQPAEPELWG